MRFTLLNNHINGKSKRIKKSKKSNKNRIKNRTYYYFNDIFNIKDFQSNLLRIDKKQ